MKKRNITFTLLLCLLSLSVSIMPFSFINVIAQNKTKEIKIRGYVTKVNSPTSFEVDNYLVSRDEKLNYEFENASAGITFKPEDLRAGMEVEVRGYYDEQTNELKAKKIKINLSQFKKIKTTTILNSPPDGIEKTAEGWRGLLIADGNVIRIEPDTKVLFELNKIEKKKIEEQAKQKAKENKDKKTKQPVNTDDDDDDEYAEFTPLNSLADVKAGMLMTYEGQPQIDGGVVATRVTFMRNETLKEETDLWNSYKITEKPADLAAGKAAEIKIESVGKFKILPDKDVQDYVSRLGKSLIPKYQRELSDSDPLKIPFKFSVIIDSDPGAFALPNGMIFVNSALLNAVENEAQLAYVLSHEIAHVTQEHTLRQMNKDRKKRTALMVLGILAALGGDFSTSDRVDYLLAAMTYGYQMTLENQADRIGLDYLIEAGYDPREAVRVWNFVTKKYGNSNVFWFSEDNSTMRRSFLSYKLNSLHSDTAFEKMNKGNTEELQKISQAVIEATKKVKK